MVIPDDRSLKLVRRVETRAPSLAAMQAIFADAIKPLLDRRDRISQWCLCVSDPKAISLQTIDELVRSQDRLYQCCRRWVQVHQVSRLIGCEQQISLIPWNIAAKHERDIGDWFI